MKTPLILFLLALLIRIAAISYWQFDGLYGQDPFAYYGQAVAIAQTGWPPTDFFWPNGYPLLVSALMLVMGYSAVAGQVVSVVCGAALAPLCYLISRDLFLPAGKLAGIIAGLIVAVAGQAVLSSIVIMADVPALFWATLSVWCAIRYGRRSGRGGWLLAAGLALAMAVISRWIYALITPGLVLYVAYVIRYHQRRWIQTLWAVGGGLLILLPQLWLTLQSERGLSHNWLTGWRPINFFLRHFETVDGIAQYRLPNGIFYAQPAGHPAFIFPVLGVFSLWGLWRLWQSRQWGALALLPGWLGPVYLFLGGIPYQNLRFGLALYTPFVLLTGYGLSEIWLRWRDRLNYRRGMAAAFGLSLIAMLVWSYFMLNRFLPPQNESKAIAAQVAQLLPADSALLTFGLTLTLQHYTDLDTREFFYEDPASLASLSAEPGPRYLLLNTQNIESQWPGRAPYLNYYWLKEHTELVQVAEFPPYQLFEIRSE